MECISHMGKATVSYISVVSPAVPHILCDGVHIMTTAMKKSIKYYLILPFRSCFVDD